MVARWSRPPHLAAEIPAVTPSLAAQLELCPLSVVYSKDPAYSSLAQRWSHFAALGETCHSLWEQAARGRFDGIPEPDLLAALNNAWDEAERAAVAKLTATLAGATPPPPLQWPDYLTKRLGVLHLIEQSINAHRDAQQAPPGKPRTEVEETLDAPGLRLRGRPDRVYTGPDGPHIVDLKTCRAEETIRPEHRRQLLAYAFIYHALRGEWPTTATIQYVAGERHTIAVDPAEATAVASEMLTALDRLNSYEGDPLSLATPSPDACRWCAFKAACPPFWSELDATWDARQADIRGVAESVAPAGTAPFIELRVLQSNLEDAPEMVTAVASDAQAIEGVRVGDLVAIVGATRTRSPSTVRCLWSTVIGVDESRAVVGASVESSVAAS